MYRVALEGSDERQMFLFINEDDAMEFVSMAVEHGKYRDYHFEGFDGCDMFSAVQVDDEPRPLRISIWEVDENEINKRKLFQRESE